MTDQPAKESEVETGSSTTRLGLILFTVYAVIYLIFVVLNAFAPSTMEWMPIPGVNLAILYGFFLIVMALVLALIYGWLCRASTQS